MGRNALLAKIHIAKKELCLDDDTYRAMLRNIFKVDSAKDMSDFQLGQSIKHFQRIGWKPKSSPRPSPLAPRPSKKFDELGKRDSYAATPSQLRMIEAMWHDIYRGNNEAKHLRQFLFRVAKVNDLRFLEKKNASDVVEAIKAISRRRNGQGNVEKETEQRANRAPVSEMR